MKHMMKKIIFGTLALALCIGGISYVSAEGFRADTGIITSLFELSPKQDGYANSDIFGIGGFEALGATTTNANTLFRMAGPSIFNAITASQIATFDNMLIGAGFTELSPITAELQVDGAIQIEQLSDPDGLGNTAYLCINDFGVMSRCPGVAVGTPACITPSYGANSEQQATDTETGCDGGIFFDKVDPTLTGLGGGNHEWGCRGIGDSIALTPSDPSDVLCSHPNAMPELGGGGVGI